MITLSLLVVLYWCGSKCDHVQQLNYIM